MGPDEVICFLGFAPDALVGLERAARRSGMDPVAELSAETSVLCLGPAADERLVLKAAELGVPTCTAAEFRALVVRDAEETGTARDRSRRVSRRDATGWQRQVSDLHSARNRMTHVLLGIFFGGVCAHNFYSGRWALALTKGLIQFAALLWWLNELYRAVPEDAAWTGFLGFWLFVWVVGLVQVWNLLEVCLVRHDAAGKPFQVA